MCKTPYLDLYNEKFTGGYGPAFKQIFEDAPKDSVASIFMMSTRAEMNIHGDPQFLEKLLVHYPEKFD